jgi:thiamine kinase-like enzyme
LNKRIINSQEFLQKLVSEINWLHQTKFTSKILKHNYFDAIKYAKLSTKHHQKYYVLLNKYHNLPLCLSHNDLSADNLLLTVKKQIIFIDYE